ncbi:SDR family NAD(P)-dependent oxidoreductase [Stenotrophomonas mori]|uniref:SDR family oxidoreductase n=1 Tax=Stenotrophomonas mori TaxID=2871096 RepID=A0ABT0SHQ2_9GAMM|nr:SDR family NAD(P)-dependent oxidoreductase [Stenotrophomonas mori]MCL7714871.1 SDR family oxidoreductase [Stenotrophomonas mori]
MHLDFSGKTALVTGAASGIGEAVARQLAASGARVVVADLNRKAAEALATTLGTNASARQLDVGDADAVKHLVDAVVAEHGGLHLAVNNAGIGGASLATADYPLEEWHRVLDVNLHGVFHSMKYEIPAILASGGGAIVNMASILGNNGWAGSTAYVAAKHAVIGMTKTAALEYSARGLRVNAVGPGFIDTPLLAGMDRGAYDGLVGLHPAGRLGTAEEVAALTCFLLSEQAAFITGSYHLVDGGFSAR